VGGLFAILYSKGIENKGIEMERTMIWAEICRDNYYSLKELETKLRIVHESQDLSILDHQKWFFESAFEKLNNEFGGVL